jgi:protein-tyrosine phosphatase
MDSDALPMSPKKVLFVCMANICRSPALEATLRHLAAKQGSQIEVDSCGLGWFHIGQPCDPRIFEAASKRGIVIEHKAQQFQDSFFSEFDLILCVNSDISEQLKLRASPKDAQKIHLATEWSSKYKGQPIPDPYYLSGSGFDDVMEIIFDSCAGLLKNRRF